MTPDYSNQHTYHCHYDNDADDDPDTDDNDDKGCASTTGCELSRFDSAWFF